MMVCSEKDHTDDLIIISGIYNKFLRRVFIEKKDLHGCFHTAMDELSHAGLDNEPRLAATVFFCKMVEISLPLEPLLNMLGYYFAQIGIDPELRGAMKEASDA